MNVMAAAHSDVGIRKSTNQDSVLIKEADTDCGRVILAVVCDGVGGLAKGELASATLVRAFSGWFQEELPAMLCQKIRPEQLERAWKILIRDTNEKLLEYGRRNHIQLGTTVVALLLADGMYYIVNIGDSRAYLLDEHIQKLTKDQTYVQREMDKGRMTYEESLEDPRRNVLLQCVGASAHTEPDFYQGRIPENAVFILCSDGFCHAITEEEIYRFMCPQVLVTENAMTEAAVRLVGMNKIRRENDDISVAIVRVRTRGQRC